MAKKQQYVSFRNQKTVPFSDLEIGQSFSIWGIEFIKYDDNNKLRMKDGVISNANPRMRVLRHYKTEILRFFVEEKRFQF